MYKKIALIVAMQEEAEIIAQGLKLQKYASNELTKLPITSWCSADSSLYIFCNGKDSAHKVNRVGMVPAALTTSVAISNIKPDLIISLGTAGAVSDSNIKVNDIVYSEKYILCHDKNIAVVGYENYALGYFPCIKLANLEQRFPLKPAIISSANSFPVLPENKARFLANGAKVEDMEAAACAEIAKIYQIDFLAIKVITNFLDNDDSDLKAFANNFNYAMTRLALVLPLLIAFLKSSLAVQN